MHKQNSERGKQGQEVDIEARMHTYYGAALSEQPLSESAWQTLQAQLGTQDAPQQRGRRYSKLRRPHHAAPIYIQDAFWTIVHQSHFLGRQPNLRYIYRSHEPGIRVSRWRHVGLQLILPLPPANPLEQAELDVLLASGLARYVLMCRLAYSALRVSFVSLAGLITLALFVLERYLSWLLVIPIVVVCYVGVWLFLRLQKRSMILASDLLVVQWLGRERACQGLHALANRSRRPSRSSRGEPSLTERIARVCGTRVEARDDRLTLVR